jgi:hypothetical protein
VSWRVMIAVDMGLLASHCSLPVLRQLQPVHP